MIFWQLFILFTRVAFFSWGGGPASLALMQRESIAAGYVTADDFADAVAFGNALPGPIAPQVSAFIGYKVAGVYGAIAAVAGTVLPTTVLMLIMVIFFFGIKDNQIIQSMLKAVRPVVVGLLIWTAFDMAISVFGVDKLGWGQAFLQNWDKTALVVVSFLVLTFTSINPVFVILGAAVIGLIFYR